MTHTIPHPPPPAESGALEARFGLRVAARLHRASQDVPHDIGERLRVAREAAVARARKSQVVAVRTPVRTVQSAGRGVLSLGGGEPWWVRLTALAPLVVLLAGLFMLHEWQLREQIDVAAEIDAALLSDDLPPSAYADPGFAEFLSVSGDPQAQ